MSAMVPNQVVDHSVGGSNLDVCVVVVERDKGVGAHRIGKDTRLWVVEWRSIDIALGLVEEIRLECVLQRQQVVRGMVDGPELVPGETAAIWGVPQANVPLGAPIEQGFFIDLVVDSQQPSIFMDSRGRSG